MATHREKAVIGPTPFAPTYKSIFTLQEPMQPLLKTMPHVNCSYLSTPGIAPTLLQLKQHAQSLCILIKYLTVNTLPGLINNAESEILGAPTFSDGESYDFLNDLTQAYTGPVHPALTRHHKMPLTALLNVLEHDITSDDDTPTHPRQRGYQDPAMVVRDICPLRRAHPSLIAPNQPSLPYATHQALIAHANDILERLDHEYSAKGGLLSILPPKEQTQDRALAETTLLGQLILYIQRLVQRVHDLERQYANALDALAGEAAVPRQALSRLGPDGRAPREMVYPQDRFVLVNAGEDVWNFLHTQFAKKEVADGKVAAMYKAQGVTGEALWQQRGGQEMARGITAVNITTRYYRLRQDPLQTIFVIPAHGEHPGTQLTRTMETQPSVVSVVKPVWPERASMWEMRHRAELDELTKLRQAHRVAIMDLDVKRSAEQLLLADNKLKDASITALQAELLHVKAYLALPENERQRALIETTAQATADRLAAAASQRALDAEAEKQMQARIALEAERVAVAAEREQRQTAANSELDTLRQTGRRLQLDGEQRDLRTGETARLLHRQLEEAWRPRMRETEVLVRYLRKMAQPLMADAQPPREMVQAGWAQADEEVDRILSGSELLREEEGGTDGGEEGEGDSSMEGGY